MGTNDMTMMTSLKAFLFPAATTPGGVGGMPSVPATGTTDFAQLLGGLDAQATAAATATTPAASAAPLAVPSVPSDAVAPPVALAINPAAVPAEPAAMSPQFVATASTPAALSAIASPSLLPPTLVTEDGLETAVPVPMTPAEAVTSWHPASTAQLAPEAPLAQQPAGAAPALAPAEPEAPVDPAMPTETVLPEQVETAEAPVQEMANGPVPSITLPKAPLAADPAPVAVEESGDSPKPAPVMAAKGIKPVAAPLPPPIAETSDPVAIEAGDADAIQSDDGQSEDGEVAAAPLPASDALPLPIIQMVTPQPAPVVDATPKSVPVDAVASATKAEVPAMAPVAAPLPLPAVAPVVDGVTPAAAPALASAAMQGGETSPPIDQLEGQAPVSAIATPVVERGVLAPSAAIATPVVELPVIEQGVSAPTAAPVRAEIVSLLQFARDHMTGRGGHRVEQSAVKGASVGDSAATPDAPASFPAFDLPTPSTAPVSSTVAPASPTASAPIAPTTDLSASLGAQVVDMGVSGQWIDGLARDIAGLSANGAQGRFEINAQQLGPVQVDIRQGADGATVSLTAATEQAVEALRQDSDRLKADAALSAVRIADVRIERAVPTGDTVRADTQSQQQNQGSSQQHQHQNSASWNAMGQNAGQSASGQGQGQAQNRWQSRENFAFGHKAGGDGAVLNHDQSGESAARYA